MEFINQYNKIMKIHRCLCSYEKMHRKQGRTNKKKLEIKMGIIYHEFVNINLVFIYDMILIN